MEKHTHFAGEYPAPSRLNRTSRESQSAEEFLAFYGITLKHSVRDNFRIVKPTVATVKGLPHYGEVCARATDGLTLWVEITWLPSQPVVEISKGNFLGKVVPPNTKETGGFSCREPKEKEDDLEKLAEDLVKNLKVKKQVEVLLELLQD